MARYSKRIVFQATLVVAAVVFAAVTARAQLLMNGDFETGTNTPWVLFNTASVVTNHPHTGLYSLQTYGPFGVNYDASFARQDFTSGFSPGQIWVLDGYVLDSSADPMTGPNGFAVAQVKFFNGGASGTCIQTNQSVGYGTDVAIPEDQWQHFAVVAPVPAAADTMEVNILHVGISGSGGSSWFDDITLYQQTQVTNTLAATTQRGVQVNWPAVAGSHTQVQSATNLGKPTVWSNLGPVWHGGSGTTNQMPDLINGAPQKFYTIIQVQ